MLCVGHALIFTIFLCLIIAPTAAPQSVSTISSNVTSITIQWEEVPCQHRNGMINSYQISYSGGNVTVVGTMFTATQLLPRRNYTFSVTALGASSTPSPPATVTSQTSVLQCESCHITKRAMISFCTTYKCRCEVHLT